MIAVISLAAAAVLAAGYVQWSGSGATHAEILGLSLSCAVLVVVINGIGDYFALRRTRDSERLIPLLILRSLGIAALTAVVVAAGSLYVAGSYGTTRTTLLGQFAAVTVLSGTVAYGELISRYRDAPGRLLAASPTLVYLCVNIAAGVAALMLVKEFAVFPAPTAVAGQVTPPDHRHVYEAMLAGFGAIAFFRTSLFTVRVSGTDLGIGPSTLLKALLESSDMMLDRWQADHRGEAIAGIMDTIDFDKARIALPSLCFALTQTVQAQDRATLGDTVKQMAAAENTMPHAAKSLVLGVLLIQLVGAPVLKRAIGMLGRSIQQG